MEPVKQFSYRQILEHREGFRLRDPQRIIQISIMNYFFMISDILVVRVLLLGYSFYRSFYL